MLQRIMCWLGAHQKRKGDFNWKHTYYCAFCGKKFRINLSY